MAGILFGELTRKDLSKKMDTGEEFRILFLDFSFRILFFTCINKCIHDLHRAYSISELRWRWTFYRLQKFASKHI